MESEAWDRRAMKTAFVVASIVVASLSLASLLACSKKEETTTTTTYGSTGAPTMPGSGGSNADYDAAKACCDALMAMSTDPEEGGAFRRAGAACVTKTADVLTGNATKADVLAVVAPIAPAGKLPDACK
jgi:hypothetical protein